MRRARPTFRPPAQAANERREAIAAARPVVAAMLDRLQQVNLEGAIQYEIVPAGTRLPSPRLYSPSTTRLGPRHYKVTIPYKTYYVMDLNGQIEAVRDTATLEVRNGQAEGASYWSGAGGEYGDYAGRPSHAVAVGGMMLALFAIGPLVIMPFIIKGFKPKWSYGRRVAVGMGVTMAIGAATRIAGGGQRRAMRQVEAR